MGDRFNYLRIFRWWEAQMSDYTQTYSYTKVDNVDIVEAQDFEDLESEFALIETAVNSKADGSGADLVFATISDGTITITDFVDEDDMTSDSAVMLPTQQSVKKYVDDREIAAVATAATASEAYTDSKSDWIVKVTGDSPVTAVLGENYCFDLSGGAITLNLPSVGASEDGNFVGWKVDENATTNNLSIVGADTDTIAGDAATPTTLVINVDHVGGQLVYDDTNTNWVM